MNVNGSVSQVSVGVAMFLLWLLSCAVIGRWSVSKGKSFWEGFLISLFVSPMVGFFVVALSDNRMKALRP